MFYLFIFESIGTSELLLIGLVALIIFGPRKLPELARMLGKARNEFKNATDEFKQTWEREVDFENIERQSDSELNVLKAENSISKNSISMKNEIVIPEVKEINQNDFPMLNQIEKSSAVKPVENNNTSDKRDWL